MPRCSVVIPAYNVRPYVGRAIDSALTQTYRDLEVIVVNDGSTDGTVSAIEPFMQRIVYVEQENRGLAAARNRALEVASGEFIALLDADDEWLPFRLQKLIGALDARPDISFVTSDCFLVKENDQSRRETYYLSRPRRERFRVREQAYWIIQYNFIFIMTVLRRRLFEEHGKFDQTLTAAEDWDLWLRFITKGEQVGLVNEPLGRYLVRSEGLSYDPRRVWPNELAILERASNRQESSTITGLRGRLELARGKNALASGEFDQAAGHFRQAAGDSGLPRRDRVEALMCWAAPKQAWVRYSRRLRL